MRIAPAAFRRAGDRRVSRRDVSGEHFGCSGGGLARHVDQILERHGNAVQRAAGLPGRAFGIGALRRRARLLRIDTDKGVGAWLLARDGGQRFLDEFGGRERAGAQPAQGVMYGHQRSLSAA
jgi:hypothetical protein